MTMLQNQAPDTLPNVLHDQGFPNTLGGIGLAAPAARSWLRGLEMVAALAGLVALVVLLALLFGGAI